MMKYVMQILISEYASNCISNVRRYHDHHFKPPTMDELPVPRGSWQAQYDANQRRHNAALLIGVVFTVGTLIVAKTSGLIYLNYSPPKSLD